MKRPLHTASGTFYVTDQGTLAIDQLPNGMRVVDAAEWDTLAGFSAPVTAQSAPINPQRYRSIRTLADAARLTTVPE